MTQRLRRAVLQFSSCLDDVTSLQRRVLLLRAGVGAGPPRSRRGVARRLDLRPQRVRRLERTGLRRVRALVRGGSCAGDSGGSGVASGGGTATGVGGGDGGSALLATADGTSGSEGAGGTDGSGSSSGAGSGANGGSGESGGVRGESDTRPPELFGSGGDIGTSTVPGGTPLLVALALVLLAALAGFAAPQLGRRVRSG